MGFALQGVIPSTKPLAIHHRQTTLLPLLPPVAHSKVLGLEFLWARDPLPRMVRNHTIYRLQGLRPRASQPSFQATSNMPCHLDLPLLGFHLLMVLTLTGVQNLRSATATLRIPLVCRQIS